MPTPWSSPVPDPWRPIVLAAGGTGGHMFPAEALAHCLAARGQAVALFIDGRGADFSERLPGMAVHRIAAGRSDGGAIGKLRGARRATWGTLQAWRLLGRLNPKVVVGFGGYASFPAAMAALLRRAPLVLQEQNAILGRANRLLAPRAAAIAVGFPQRGETPAKAPIHVTGNPVRPGVAALAGAGLAWPSPDGVLDVVVTGGSQGAAVFGGVLPELVASLDPSARARLRLTQQVRPEALEEVARAYRDLDFPAETAAFFDDLPERMRRAHLVIARAGASTLSEITVLGRPSILVPYPHAMDDHQRANACVLAEAGAAWVLSQENDARAGNAAPEHRFTATRLAELLRGFLANPAILRDAGARAAGLAPANAAERLAEIVMNAAHGVTEQPREKGAT